MFDSRKLMNRAWMLAAIVALADLVWMPLAGISVDPVLALKRIVPGVGLLGLAWFYTHKRPSQVLAVLLESAAFLVLFTHALAIMSYLGTALGRPFYDDVFDAADRALGFDFMSHLGFVAAQPLLAAILDYTYSTSLIQVALVVLVLAFTQQLDRLRAFAALFAITATATIVIATLLPTIGSYAFYNVPDAMLPAFRDPRAGWDQVKHILALREGSMRVIPLEDLRGLVSFPSFHTALAIITIWAMLRTRYIAPCFFALNMPLILATPTNGSHYLCDIFGGALVAFAGLWLVSGYQGRVVARERQRAPALA